MALKTITGVLVVFVGITAAVEGGQSNCSNGLAGVKNEMGTICCLEVCDFCGGPGCGSINSTTADDCCTSNIEASGVYCEDSNEAPCIISNDSDSSAITSALSMAPTTPLFSSTQKTTSTNCSNGISGFENEIGTICCAETCEVCGVSNCSSNVGGTPSDCCVSNILDSGVYCDDSNEAPCILSFETTSGPTTPTTTAFLTRFTSSTSSPLGGAISEVLTAAPTLYPQRPNTTSEVEDNLTARAIIGIVAGVVVVLFIVILSVVFGLKNQQRQWEAVQDAI